MSAVDREVTHVTQAGSGNAAIAQHSGPEDQESNPQPQHGKLWTLKLNPNKKRPHRILAIDGGGMRGMIPACVLEEIELAIKEEALELLQDPNSNFREVLVLHNPSTGKEVFPTQAEIMQTKDFNVDLADFFDLVSGTSTGAILAAYLATKGANCESAILKPTEPKAVKRYKDSIERFKQHRLIATAAAAAAANAADKADSDCDVKVVPGQADNSSGFAGKGDGADNGAAADDDIKPGSAAAAQALFAAVGGEVFTKFGGNWNPVKGLQLVRSLYGSGGIDSVLQNILKKPGTEDFIKLSDNECLHTSLLIPSFQIEYNRPVVFWHLHRPRSRCGSNWGYSTLNILKAFEGMEQLGVPHDEIVDAVASALARHLPPTSDGATWSADGVASLTPEQFKAVRLTTLIRAQPQAEISDMISRSEGYSEFKAVRLPPLSEDYSDRQTIDLALVAGDVLRDLHGLKGFTQDSLKGLISKAFKRLEQEGLPPAEDRTFRSVLLDVLVPTLRRDMETTMYVLKEQQPEKEAATPSAERVVAGPCPRAHDFRAAVAAKLASMRRSLSGEIAGTGFTQWQPCRFYEAQSGSSQHVYDVDFHLWDVVRASTAAPSFFPAHHLTSQGIGNPPTRIVLDHTLEPLLRGMFADGGVVANDPTLSAIAFLERAYGAAPSNIAVLSLGCGSVTGSLDVRQTAGGLAWALPLITQVFMGSSPDTISALAEMVLTADARGSKQGGASRYLRIQAVGFAPRESSWWRRLSVRLGIKRAVPRLRMVSPEPTQAPQPGERNGIRRDVNFLAIDPTADGKPVSEKYSNKELRNALQAMDKPDDWEKLMEIGRALSTHFKQDIRAWVRHHILLAGNDSAPATPTARH